MSLYDFLKEWRKNPKWSFSCCLALLLPFNDLQGEISGMTGTDVLKSQLQTGNIEMTTILGAVQNSGAMDVTLENDNRTTNLETVQNDDSQGTEYNATHQETQTELTTLAFIPVSMTHEQIECERTRGGALRSMKTEPGIKQELELNTFYPKKTWNLSKVTAILN